MKNKKSFIYVVVGTLLVVLGWINGRLLTYESILQDGYEIYLPFEAKDASSLMNEAGFHMRYNNDLLPRDVRFNAPVNGTMIVKYGDKKQVDFIRLDDGSPLTDGEMRIKYRMRWKAGLGLSSTAPGFFVGAAKIALPKGRYDDYTKARYGVLRVGPMGNALLTGLADKKFRPIVSWKNGYIEFNS